MPDNAKSSSQRRQQMIEKSAACNSVIIIVTGCLQRLSSRFLVPESNFRPELIFVSEFNLRLELSQFLVHSSLRGANGVHQLREFHVDGKRLNLLSWP